MTARAWGWWSSHKLDILEDYLSAFARASSSVPQRIYLDLFAGRPENVHRDTNEEILGSVHRALRAKPPFTHVHLFELPYNAKQLRDSVDERYPGYGVRVHDGDCNQTIDSALEELRPVNWAPTFAFVDQQAAEVRWETLEKIARFRRGKTKAEMWILFGASYLSRGLEVGQEHMNAKFGERISALYGCDDWVRITNAQREGRLSPGEVRVEMVNLMRWRLEHDLGYSSSHPFTMKNTNGHDIHEMIFVTDHHAGEKIMAHLYGAAMRDQPNMQREALARRRVQKQIKKHKEEGQDGLFDLEPSAVQVPTTVDVNRLYQYEPPAPPYGNRAE